MQVLITHGSMARARVLQFQRWQHLLIVLALTALIMTGAGAVYHCGLVKAARAGWPIVNALLHLVVRDEIAQRDRFTRDNLDAMVRQVGEMQAKLVKLEAMGERV